MTRNIYLGGNIFRLAEASSLQQIPPIVGELFGNVVATDFAARAEALADEIAATDPALIGLQEVELFRIQEESDFLTNPLPNAQTVRFDFLQILLDALDEKGLEYSVAAQVQNTDAELPGILDPANPGDLTDIRVTDFDVILARAGVQTSDPVTRNYAVSAVLGVGGVSVPFPRGYAKVEATVDGARFTFVNTHVEGLMPAHEAQINQLLSELQSFPEPVVLVGDLNTAADGSGTPGYEILVVEGPFQDAWTEAGSIGNGFTCCFGADLMDPTTAALDERIDFVLFRGDVEVVSTEVVGDELGDRTPSGLWPSDHAGVVATLRVPR